MDNRAVRNTLVCVGIISLLGALCAGTPITVQIPLTWRYEFLVTAVLIFLLLGTPHKLPAVIHGLIVSRLDGVRQKWLVVDNSLNSVKLLQGIAVCFFCSGIAAVIWAQLSLAGVLTAFAGQFIVQARAARDSEEKRSLFYLESFKTAYASALDLLKDGNNNRITWIRAGRELCHAEDFAKGITNPSHKQVLQLERLKYRAGFHACLEGKPDEFFFCLKDLSEISNNGNVPLMLAPRSIYAVWQAAQWPDDYSDPLTDDFSSRDWVKRVRYSGLRSYLERINELGQTQ